MPPHGDLVHLTVDDWRDSNVGLVNSDVDHKVKHDSAATEPAWRGVGEAAGLYVWRIEDFRVVAWPEERYGEFHGGDSYVILHSYGVGSEDNDGNDGNERLGHDVFFWLGAESSRDEVGTAAYKAVELDEYLGGAATQHRELQAAASDEFVALFPRIRILAGGVRSGFTHVEAGGGEEGGRREAMTLLRVFKHPRAKRADSVFVYEVEPSWRSLDENDVFVLETDGKIWVWQGEKCSPMEKARAAQVVHDMTIAKHVDVEVVSQAEARSRMVVHLLGGEDASGPFRAARPIASRQSSPRPRKLWRLSDASGALEFDVVKAGDEITRSDLDGNDVFLLDTGTSVWVWQGAGASRAERTAWIRVAEAYVRHVDGSGSGSEGASASPIAKVVQGNESAAFWRALETAV